MQHRRRQCSIRKDFRTRANTWSIHAAKNVTYLHSPLQDHATVPTAQKSHLTVLLMGEPSAIVEGRIWGIQAAPRRGVWRLHDHHGSDEWPVVRFMLQGGCSHVCHNGLVGPVKRKQQRQRDVVSQSNLSTALPLHTGNAVCSLSEGTLLPFTPIQSKTHPWPNTFLALCY